MHMSSTSADQSILDGDTSLLGTWLWERLNPDQWPLQIEDLPIGSALVGGAVRDALLERLDGRKDLDLVVPNNAVKLTTTLANRLGGTCVILDPVRDIARLIINGWTIDVARQVGNSLDEDLRNRDFRLNAISIIFHPYPKIIDPTGGLEDIRRKSIGAISESNLIDDPIRLLRGLRLMAELRLSLDSQTKTWLMKHSQLVKRAAPERIQAEILRFVEAPWFDEVVPILKRIGLLHPWRTSEKDLKKNVPSLSDAKVLLDTEASIALPLARITHLLSDEGLVQLRFSRRQCRRCSLLRKWEARNDGFAFEGLSEKDRLRLHHDLENDLPALILCLKKTQQIVWLRRWRDSYDPLFHPSSPVDGHTLQDSLDLPAGPEIGSLISFLCHERAFGRVQNKDEALEAARYWWQQKQTLL